MTAAFAGIRRLTAAGAVLSGMSAAVTLVNAVTLPKLAAPRSPTTENIVVCIPARNEATRLPELLGDLRAQTGCPELRVLVLDDGSTDATFDVAEIAIAADPRFALLRTTDEPPAGWTGKAAACRTLADRALEGDVDCIVFIDADVRLDRRAIASAARALRSTGASLVCPWPRQLAGTLAESLLQPLLAFSWMSTLPVRVANASTLPSTVVACGQFMMFDAAAYRSIGGHAAVAASLTEDLDIARALRRGGGSTVVMAGGEFVRCRMYEGWSDLRDGYTRWLWNAFGGVAASVSVSSAMSVMYLLPPAAALCASGATRRWGVTGYTLAVASRIVSSWTESGHAGLPLGAAGLRNVAVSAAHPLSVAIYIGLTAASFRRRRRGSATWKDRPLPTSGRA